jgi:hypothetical protein
MNRAVLIAAVIAIIPCVGGGHAAESSATRSLLFKVVPVELSAKLTSPATIGVCDQGFSNQCAVSPCVCEKFDGTVASPAFGEGSATIDLTLDAGNAIGNGAQFAGIGCLPGYGSVGISASGGIFTLSAIVSVCSPTTHLSSPSKAKTEPVSGSFAIQQAAVNETGYGFFQGQYYIHSEMLVVKGKMAIVP